SQARHLTMKARGFFIVLMVFTTACFSWWTIQLERLNRHSLEMKEELLYAEVDKAQNFMVWMSKQSKSGDSLISFQVGENTLFMSQNQWEELSFRYPKLDFSKAGSFIQIAPKPIAIDTIHEASRASTWRQVLESSFFFILLCIGFIWIYRGLVSVISMSERQNDFLVSVTHELKTPIASSRLLFETMLRHELELQEKRRLAEAGIKGTHKQLELVESLLVASQLENRYYEFPKQTLALSDWLIKEV
ncbi:MAG: hypothetical protein LPK45_06060, partial [Bacteroidota bacterium]|nr:hypothetical protein [Bacteroidota bacterium]MDX5430633.1 hypothetical protein [Bacteroidota bacterium]MDX5469383.1 hypothetical protein [Bacteroidota bacterium]